MGAQRIGHGRSHCLGMRLAPVWRLVYGFLAAAIAALFATRRPFILVGYGV